MEIREPRSQAPLVGQPTSAPPLIDIVVVSYNCRPYLYQTLVAVRQSVAHLQAAHGGTHPVAAVWVVDNNSPDGCAQMVRAQFPDVRLIASPENLGFSRANNLAIREGAAPWVLLLNPDTILAPETLAEALAFANAHPEAGGLGLKQVSPRGRFMPESKRGNPTPWVAFYKLVGLSALFPRSPRFGAYYQRHIGENEVGAVPILSGAAMLLRRSVLDEIGLLDERFFLYGEDIDLSYRVVLGGYQNYYVPQARLLHYKGRSTPKTNLRYLWVFYEAMWLFAQKHLKGTSKVAWRLPVALAIAVRGATAFLARGLSLLTVPLVEAAILVTLTVAIAVAWGAAVVYEHGTYPPYFRYVVAPSLALLYSASLALTGAYHRPFGVRPVLSGVAMGFLAVVVVSYLWPEWNYSRAVVLLSAGAVLAEALALRLVLSRRHRLDTSGTPAVVAGRSPAVRKLLELLSQNPEYSPNLVRIVSPDLPLPGWEGIWQQTDLSERSLTEALRTSGAAELVLAEPFGLGLNVPALVVALGETYTVRVQPDGSPYLIGPEYWQDTELSAVLSGYEQRQWRFRKRVLALAVSSGLLITYPLLFWRYYAPAKALRALGQVWLGRRGLVGYQTAASDSLPGLPPGVLTTALITPLRTGPSHQAADHYYAARAALRLDLAVLLKGWRRIGLS